MMECEGPYEKHGLNAMGKMLPFLESLEYLDLSENFIEQSEMAEFLTAVRWWLRGGHVAVVTRWSRRLRGGGYVAATRWPACSPRSAGLSRSHELEVMVQPSRYGYCPAHAHRTLLLARA